MPYERGVCATHTATKYRNTTAATRHPEGFIAIPDRMDPEIEERVTEEANANVFGCGFAQPANRPSTWSEED